MQRQFEKIRDNRFFNIGVIAVIATSALLAGAKTYHLPPHVVKTIYVLDWLITILFMVELSIRFMSEKNKKYFLRDPWNAFDFIVILVSIMPFENSEYAVVGRLIRVIRVLRIVAIIPEMRLIMNSLAKALPELVYVAGLLFVIFYIYAVMGTNFFGDISARWDTLGHTLVTLLQIMVFDNVSSVMLETMKIYPLSWIYHLSFMILTSFSLINTIIGIVANVIEEEHEAARAKKDREEGHATLDELRDEIMELKEIMENMKK